MKFSFDSLVSKHATATRILNDAMDHISPYRKPDYNGTNYRPEHYACLVLCAALERVGK